MTNSGTSHAFAPCPPSRVQVCAWGEGGLGSPRFAYTIAPSHKKYLVNRTGGAHSEPWERAPPRPKLEQVGTLPGGSKQLRVVAVIRRFAARILKTVDGLAPKEDLRLDSPDGVAAS